VFAQVVNSGHYGVRTGFRVFAIQYEPIHSDVFLYLGVRQPKRSDGWIAELYDHGERYRVRCRCNYFVEFYAAEYHTRQQYSAYCAGPRVFTDLHRNGKNCRSNSRLRAIRHFEHQ